MHAQSLQSCLTPCDPMDCSPPGSSVHGILQARNTGVGSRALLQGIFPTRGLNCNSSLLHWKVCSLSLAPTPKPNSGWRLCCFQCFVCMFSHEHFCMKLLVHTISLGHWLEDKLLHCRPLLFCLPQSVQFSRSVMSDSLWPHEPQHARPPCPSPTPGVYSDLCPSSRWCHLILCHPLLLLPPIPPSIRVFPNESTLCMRWPEYWSSASASVLPMNTQDWSPLGWIGWISCLSP